MVTGCYAQTNPDAVAAIPGVDVVLGTRDRHALPDLLGDLRKRARPLVRVGDVFRPEVAEVFKPLSTMAPIPESSKLDKPKAEREAKEPAMAQ